MIEILCNNCIHSRDSLGCLNKELDLTEKESIKILASMEDCPVYEIDYYNGNRHGCWDNKEWGKKICFCGSSICAIPPKGESNG